MDKQFLETLSSRRKEFVPLFFEGGLYLPKWGMERKQVPLHPSEMFQHRHPISVEFCSGNGDWIVERASRESTKNWIAVERRGDRACKIWKKRDKYSLPNLFLVYGDAKDFVELCLEEGSVSESFINFPDPWPKHRHAKHRLVQAPFLSQLGRVMKKGGTLILLTDDPLSKDEMIQELEKSKTWRPLLRFPFFQRTWEGYGDSFFSLLFQKKQVPLHFLPYENRGDL